MFLVFGALLLLVILVSVFSNIEIIKENIRYCILLNKLPTAPGKQFFFGHALQFFGKKPVEIFAISRRWVEKSPPVFTVYLGPTLVFVGAVGPEEVEILIGSMKHLEKASSYEFLHNWLEEGLLTSAGSKWQKRRKILTPAFHFSILLEFMDVFNRDSLNFVKEVEAKHLNQSVDLLKLMSNFTLLTLSETSMGKKVDLNSKEGKIYKDAIFEMAEITFQRVITPWLWYHKIFDMTSLRKLQVTVLKNLHNFTTNIIRERSESFKTFDENVSDSDIKRKYPLLDILLNAKFKDNSIDEKGIREEVDTFMFEGHDTTAVCLAFTTMLLACHKEIQQEVYQEIVSILGPDLSQEPTYTDLQQMTLLERCIKESLRLYPPVPLIGRKASEDISTKYGIIPKGATIFTLLYYLHRNPNIWKNPHDFDPSRYLPENSQGRHTFAYAPFSAGPRNCIGQRFAMLEMKALFCGLLRRFVLHPIDTPETVVLYQDFLLRSQNPLRVKFALRRI